MKDEEIMKTIDAPPTTEALIAKLDKVNGEILALKARIAMRRETLMLQLIDAYTRRINNAKSLETAKFFNQILINEICMIDESPKLKELLDEVPEL